MSLFVWNSYYNVNIEEIDNQHKKLVQFLNELFDAMKTGEASDVLSNILDGLVGYTVDHFGTEESLMRKFSYPSFNVHKEEHQKLIKRIEEFKNDFIGKKVSVSLELMDYLKNWLINHILKTDKELGKFLQGKMN